MEHKIKIWAVHWKRVFNGTKTFELRNNDRAYQKGDIVILQPYDPETKLYLWGPTNDGGDYCDLRREIGDVYPIDDNKVVFSLLKPK